MFLIHQHLWRYALYRAYLNMIREASRYHLAWIWWFLEPIAMTGVFFFVFTYLRAPNAENFQYFLIIGVTTWLWFANGVSNSTDSLLVAKGIISQMRLPKMLFPIINVISASLKHVFVFGTVLIVMALTFGPSVAWWYLPILILSQLLLILAFASTVALACCWIRDLRFVVRSGLTLMMFCSGLFFAIETMPAAYQQVLRLNPMAMLIEDYRTVLIAAEGPDVLSVLKIAGASFAWLLMMKWAYARWDLTLTRRVIA